MNVVALGHRFPNLDIEAEILASAGVQLVDAVSSADANRERTLRQADGVLLGSASLSKAEWAALESCRAVVRYGVGVDNVDLEWASRRGAIVSRVPHYGAEDVALHTLALILALARRLHTAMDITRQGDWALGPLPIPHRPEQETVGVVGLGAIGRRVVAYARAVGYQVVASDVAPPADTDVAVVSLDELLSASTYVALHVPLGVDTAGLIGRRELALLPRGGHVINTARGGLVDEGALLEALNSGAVAGAALDVLASEPPRDNPLLTHPRVIVTPHMAWFSAEARATLQRQAAEEMVRCLVGSAPRWAVHAPNSQQP